MTAGLSATELREPPILDIDPFSDGNLRNPYPFFETLRETAPVVYLAPLNCYAVGRYDEVATVASDYARFTSSTGIGWSDITKPGALRARSPITEVDPPDHSRVRAALTRVLSPLVIRSWREAFLKEAEVVADRVLDQGDVDGVRDIAEGFVLTVFPRVFGIDVPKERLILTGELNFNQLGPDNDRLRAALKRAEPYLEWYADALQRHNMLPGGFGEKIYLAEDAGDFDKGTAMLHVRSFFRAGTDTTMAGIGFTLNQLARQPEAWAALRADPNLIKSAFDEAIRLDSPASVLFRTTREETELSGYRLKADTKIGYYAGAGNRDPRKWERPDEFDVRRQTAGVHLAFGRGAHICIGQMIARLEAECIISALLKRVRSIQLTGEPTFRLVNALRTLDTLPLRLIPA
ncbi:cytochrome P450 [Nevskia sp.]|uniref:cytochrome P450 n=1 Tax=Nevskia sp. TaxID=1929292 RepID=UPI0025EA58FF|nr:cytochrome P450 [Nevskia sp.]